MLQTPETLRGKTVAVVGAGKSGMALLRFLLPRTARLILADLKTDIHIPPELKRSRKLVRALGPNYLKALREADLIFKSPGIDRQIIPKPLQKKITSETRLFFDLFPGRIIGVTGSSGKSTTTALIGAILNRAGGRGTAAICGNIGTPLVSVLEKKEQPRFAVAELSSFQLEDLKKSPHIAVITTLFPAHLDRHGTFTSYRRAKENIVRYQTSADTAVLNYDHPLVRTFSVQTKASALFYSRTKKLPNGIWLNNKVVQFGSKPYFSLPPLRMIGAHNLENILAAAAAAYRLGIPGRKVQRALASFKGLPHRLQPAGTRGGVLFYNDSGAVTPEAAVRSTESFKNPVVLIAGGYDRGFDWTEFAAAISRSAKHLVLYGANAPIICRAFKKTAPRFLAHVTECGPSLKEAVAAAFSKAKRGDVVLFAPGSASFDMFADFRHRGRSFTALVKNLPPRSERRND